MSLSNIQKRSGKAASDILSKIGLHFLDGYSCCVLSNERSVLHSVKVIKVTNCFRHFRFGMQNLLVKYMLAGLLGLTTSHEVLLFPLLQVFMRHFTPFIVLSPPQKTLLKLFFPTQ